MKGWTEWIQNLCTVVMTHKNLCSCIALIKWGGPVACVNVTQNVENFQSKCYHFTATKTSVTVNISEATWTWQSYPLRVFCWFQRNKDDITIVAQHGRDLFTTATERPSQERYERDWNASAIWKIFFPRCMAYQTGTYKMADKSAQS